MRSTRRSFNKGVELSPQETIKLPKPVLEDGLDRCQQQHGNRIAAGRQIRLGNVHAQSRVSPLLLKITDDGRESGRIGRRVDLYFVAYGSLDALGDDRLSAEATESDSGRRQGAEDGRAKDAIGDELGKRGLPAARSRTIRAGSP